MMGMGWWCLHVYMNVPQGDIFIFASINISANESTNESH